MSPLRILNASTFRFALYSAALFAAAGCLALGLLYLQTMRHVDNQIAAALARENSDLSRAHARGGLAGLAEAVALRMSDREGATRLYLVVDAAGGIVAGNLAAWPEAAPTPGAGPADIELDKDGRRKIRALILAFADGARLLVGRDLVERDNVRLALGESLVTAVALMLALGTAAGVATARYVLKRLQVVSRTANAILGGDLGGRVPIVGSGDEFDHLAMTLNAMLERIQRLLSTVRAVTYTIAHDLRTPLNRLHSRLELALLAPRGAEERHEAVRRALADADSLIATFNAMLRIAAIRGAGEMRLSEPVDLAELAKRAVDFYAPFAEQKGLSLIAEGVPGLPVSGDPQLLTQALANLVDNAIKFTPPGGTIVVSVAREHGRVRMTVADSGPGIPADQREEALELYARLDAGLNIPGAGLGLALVASVAEYHGAELRLEDNQPGLRVILTFPALS